MSSLKTGASALILAIFPLSLVPVKPVPYVMLTSALSGLQIPYKPQRSPRTSLGLRYILRRTVFAPACIGLEVITAGARPRSQRY